MLDAEVLSSLTIALGWLSLETLNQYGVAA